MPIKLLSDKVSSMIAAGEVIERPASVVKELVENSLDSGATEISIEIRGGGIEQIRIADNGCGIPQQEVEIAFQRFATSKLNDASDLDAIPTLGFRGEALPSIASVARMSVVTRPANQDAGTRLEIAQGSITDKQRQGASPGTVMTVSQLFRNVPARRKFLRTRATETSHIQNMVTRYALAYPEVRFALKTENSSILTPGSGILREAIAAVQGLKVAESMLDIQGDQQDVAKDAAACDVSGIISQPALSRANRGYISFFVNRRWVQSRMLGYALEQAYHGFLKERRYPIAVVNISIPYDEVDVNVHPSKTEVRFRNGDRIFSAIQQAVRRTLTAHSPIPEIRRAQSTYPASSYASRQPNRHFWHIEPFTPAPTPPSDESGEVSADAQGAAPALTNGQAGYTHKETLPMLRVIGQTQSTYILAEGPDGMYIIDQHAAHERVMFERIKADTAAASQSQSLMQPLTVELNPRQQELMQSHQSIFANLGLLIEPFGGNVFIIRGVPSILLNADPVKALTDMLDEMEQGGDVESWADRAAYSLACHAAIRAGKVLTYEEMTALTRQLEQCRQPHTCPHGRPTIIHLSAMHLEREFGRR